MIGLFLTLSLLMQAPITYSCALDDAACWRNAALKQEERAEKAEKLLDLESMARTTVERMAKEEQERGDRWQKTAMDVAPKPPAFYESPIFWGGIGLVVGAVVTVAASFALAPAHSAASK